MQIWEQKDADLFGEVLFFFIFLGKADFIKLNYRLQFLLIICTLNKWPLLKL